MAEIAKCPACRKSIDKMHDYTWCSECGEPLPMNIREMLPKLVAKAATSEADSSSNQEFLGPSRGSAAADSTGNYKVVPFIGQVKTGFFSVDNANTVARQMQAVITREAAAGWDFHSSAKVAIEVSPGCIASLFGARVSYITFDQLIFQRQPATR